MSFYAERPPYRSVPDQPGEIVLTDRCVLKPWAWRAFGVAHRIGGRYLAWPVLFLLFPFVPYKRVWRVVV